MRQVLGSYIKNIKCFFRIRAVTIFTVLMPVFLLLITGVSLSSSVSESDMPLAKGVLTVSMVAFSLMLAGILNLAGSISRDRETGLLTKLKSMPISPWRDFVGRIMAAGSLSLIAAVLIIVVGLASGARFSGTMLNDVEAVGFFLLAVASAAGIGLLVGSYTKVLMATFFTGLGITLITAFLSGIFISYDALPSALHAFAHVYPISSAASSVEYLLLGESAAGYNPVTAGQVILTVCLAAGLLVVGLFVYSRQGWKRA